MTTSVHVSKLYVVRNSAVRKDGGFLSEDWKLTPEGVLLTVPIAEASFWARVAAVYHGPELSSEQTARIIFRRWQMPTECDAGLRELSVASWMERPEFIQLIGDHLQQKVQHHLLEDSQRAERRIVQCVKRLSLRHAGQSIAIVAQGRIITALFSYLLGQSLGRTELQSLQSPDLSVVDLTTWQVEQGFFSQLRRNS